MSRTTHNTQSHNVAARMGRWSADHWKTATFGWLAFVIVAFGLGGLVGMKTSIPTPRDRASPAGWTRSSTRASSGPPARVSSSRADRYERPTRLSSPPSRTSSRASRSLNVVQNVRSPLESPNFRPDLRRRALGARRVRDPWRRTTTPPTRSPPSSTRVDEIQRAHPQFFIGEFGDASAVERGRDGVRGRPRQGRTSVAADHAGILVLAFGALVAAGIPLLLALTAVFATFGLIALPSTSSLWRCRRPRWCC